MADNTAAVTAAFERACDAALAEAAADPERLAELFAAIQAGACASLLKAALGDWRARPYVEVHRIAVHVGKGAHHGVINYVGQRHPQSYRYRGS